MLFGGLETRKGFAESNLWAFAKQTTTTLWNGHWLTHPSAVQSLTGWLTRGSRWKVPLEEFQAKQLVCCHWLLSERATFESRKSKQRRWENNKAYHLRLLRCSPGWLLGWGRRSHTQSASISLASQEGAEWDESHVFWAIRTMPELSWVGRDLGGAQIGNWMENLDIIYFLISRRLSSPASALRWTWVVWN